MNKKQEDIKVDFEKFNDLSEDEKLVKEWKFTDNEELESKDTVKTTNTISLTNERVIISTREDAKKENKYKKISYKLDDIASTTCSVDQSYRPSKLWIALLVIGGMIVALSSLISLGSGGGAAGIVICFIVAIACIVGSILIYFKGKKKYYTDIRIGVVLRTSGELEVTDLLTAVNDQRVMIKSKKHFDDIVVDAIQTATEFSQEFDNLVLQEQMKRNKSK